MKDQMKKSVQTHLALGFVASPTEKELLQLTSLEFDQLLCAALNAHTLILYHRAGDTEMLEYKN